MTANDLMAQRHITSRVQCAEAALSPQRFAAYCAPLHKIAPNPFEQGRANQEKAWARDVESEARRLVWC